MVSGKSVERNFVAGARSGAHAAAADEVYFETIERLESICSLMWSGKGIGSGRSEKRILRLMKCRRYAHEKRKTTK